MNSGRSRGTTQHKDRQLRFLTLTERFSKIWAIANQWFKERDRMLGTRTVYRQRRSFGLFIYRPHLELPFTGKNWRNGLLWCREIIQWDQENNQVIFRDGSRICVDA